MLPVGELALSDRSLSLRRWRDRRGECSARRQGSMETRELVNGARTGDPTDEQSEVSRRMTGAQKVRDCRVQCAVEQSAAIPRRRLRA